MSVINKLFIHLRVHSNYSLSEGMLSFNYLSKFCLDNKQPAMAITDTSNMFGALEYSLKMVSSGVQPIIGMQINIADITNNENIGEVVLIAKNKTGYNNLLILASGLSLNESFEKYVNFSQLENHNEGLILLTGGVENGFIGKPASLGNKITVQERIELLQNLFRDNMYIELQRHGLEVQDVAEKTLIDISHELNIPLVATNDCFFENEEKFNAHQVLTCIDKGLTISSDNRRLITKEHYLKDTESMINLFKDIPEAIDNTIVIAKRCSFFVKSHDPILPTYPGLKGMSEADYLFKISNEGLNERFKLSSKQFNEKEKQFYMERLIDELKIINKMGFSGYFLIVYDFIKWAKDNFIPVGPGRGSGAGSIVAWSLKITDLDPIRWGLLFERFLNPERVSMPDFDIDFCQDRREEVINYVRNRYGHDRVAQIITFGSLQAKAAIRDVGRVLEMPYGQVDRIAKLIPFSPANPPTIKEAIESEDELKKEIAENQEVETLIKTAIDVEGLNRHVSTHAAGLVIGDRPLNKLVPLYKFNEYEMPATQFNMKFVEKAGLVKFDFLGLKTLTVLSKAESLIQKKIKNFNLNEITLDDDETYNMLSSGSTTGIFQLESSGMKDVLIGLKPDRFEDIIAVVSLYRPGPMENIPSYINRKHGREKITYMHPSLKNILEETYGIFIYQEQVLRAAQILANFSLGSADILRRAMGKKDKIEMEQQKQSFIEGAKNKKIDANKANEIFDQISAFAGYGFNKSHAAAYALIAYQTAWIKCNFPHEFFAAMMTIEYNNTDKLSVFVNDLRRLGISILPPCINKSGSEFLIEQNEQTLSLRYSLSALKNVGNEAIKKIVNIRNTLGQFSNIDDFLKKIPYSLLTKKLLESLIQSGSFDSLEKNRNKLFQSIELILNYSQSIEKDKISNQQNLFDDTDNNQLLIDLVEKPEWAIDNKLKNEFASIGLYLQSHPLDNYLEVLKTLKIKSNIEIMDNPNKFLNKNIQLCGVVSKILKKHSFRGKWATIVLNDPNGSLEINIYSDVYHKYENYLIEQKMMLLDAEIKNETNQGIKINARRITPLNDYISEKKLNLTIFIDDVQSIKAVYDTSTNLVVGNSNLIINFSSKGQIIKFIVKENIQISSELISNVTKINNVKSINFI
mgnify:FL=1